MRWLAIAGLAFALLSGRSATAGHASAVHPLRTGFVDPTTMAGPSADRAPVRARAAGASMFRLAVWWRAIASERPADPTDPDDPGYDWSSVDEQVIGAVRAGLDPILSINASPPWARGAAVGLPGTWPSPVRFAEFARAAARRYSGTFTPTGSRESAPSGSILAGMERTERRTRTHAATGKRTPCHSLALPANGERLFRRGA